MIKITDTIQIEPWEITESFMRSSGPGGQHVNKVSSAVELRFEAERSPNLSTYVKVRLKKLAGRKWTKDGAIIITAEKHRLQPMNRALAQEKLIELIVEATKRPKYRIKTKPTRASQRRRVDTKTKRGHVKTLRGRVTDD
ncbi:MAG: alternative ribosome rescue aminoacyl-tRNA hydrolase ArfB [Amylibacter sp.]|nr:alternative ribosome rescue aminoacyl-tRNA hydrolase ArfB [Amylibacter sp.]|tara:strand:+ start:1198 stop:1617 length:420 start_codon:yes stop_codon:yes gene_type:complete